MTEDRECSLPGNERRRWAARDGDWAVAAAGDALAAAIGSGVAASAGKGTGLLPFPADACR